MDRDITYILHPGPIRSRTDGDHHFISARQLASCYNIPFNKCKVVSHTTCGRHSHKAEFGNIHLYPRMAGDYKETLEKEIERFNILKNKFPF